MIQTSQTRPTLDTALRSGSVAADIEDALGAMRSALGYQTDALVELMMAETPGDKWRHLTVDARRSLLVDYTASEIQQLRRRVR